MDRHLHDERQGMRQAHGAAVWHGTAQHSTAHDSILTRTDVVPVMLRHTM